MCSRERVEPTREMGSKFETLAVVRAAEIREGRVVVKYRGRDREEEGRRDRRVERQAEGLVREKSGNEVGGVDREIR